MNDTGSMIRYTVELHGDIHAQSSFREQVNEHGGEIVAERSVDDGEGAAGFDDNDDDIEITFGPENDIQNIETADGVSVGELQLVLQGIENDPLWLQSPADRKTDTNTAVSLSLDQELPTP